MACGMCGPPGEYTPPPRLWEHTSPDGEVGTYLTKTEARMAASMAGGGTIKQVRGE